MEARCVMSAFICPICKQRFELINGSLRCDGGHCFDVSSEGYVNLLRRPHVNAGDGADMMAARRRFLDGGFYSGLRDGVARTILRQMKAIKGPSLLLDAGCGEGYFTEALAESARQAGWCAAGVDLSKRGVAMAAKRVKGADFAVASIFELPVAEGGAGIVVSICAPISEAEFIRVLPQDGTLIVALPGKRHLFGLKKVLYDQPYENDPPKLPGGFDVKERRSVEGEITLNHREIQDLFTMTPYYYNTPKVAAERLCALESLTTETAFELFTLKKQ